MNQPLISIIIPAYNAGKNIVSTLESVLNQTWINCEIIVVNDGSTDNTSMILEQYKDKGVVVVNQANKGQDAALNHGYEYAKGDYIKFMDSDDLVNPEMIELQLKALDGSKELVAYGEWARFYNDKPELADFTKLDYWKDMTPLDFITARPEGVMLQCGIMLLPRQLIEKAGPWDERLILFNDTEFYNRILLASKGIKFTPRARLYYRSGQAGSISAGRSRKYYESTFLATQLIAGQLLEVEDSYRIRNLITNTFLNQYYHMYPKFPDLFKAHEEKIRFYGNGTLKFDGGKLFLVLSRLFGWKNARKIQIFFYELGYYKLLCMINDRKNKRSKSF